MLTITKQYIKQVDTQIRIKVHDDAWFCVRDKVSLQIRNQTINQTRGNTNNQIRDQIWTNHRTILGI